jgi:transcriptional regulator with XRE-family HTH domain
MARSTFDERFPERTSHIAKTLARNVRRLRKGKGWSQGQFADRLEVEQTVVSRNENCRANPTLETLEAIASSLGVRLVEHFETRSAK